MLENVLARRNASLKIRITVKSLVSVGIVALAVLLPQFVHLVLGQAGGMQWLPMYLPVLLGGCLLGTWWGLGVGIASPLVSFAITSAMGNAMPAAARLPFMAAELAVFAAVSGLFSRKISENGWMAFPAVLLAAVCGRARRTVSGYRPLFACARLVADSNKFCRFDFAGGRCALCRHGAEAAAGQRQT